MRLVCWVMSLLAWGNLAAQVILITGAARGIGWETARLLADQGHHVYASSRLLSSFSEEMAPDSLHVLQLDVTDDVSIAAALAVIMQQQGQLDVLINNAGCGIFGPMEVISIEQAQKMFEVNFFGVMRLMQAALPIMRDQNSGLIINVSSMSGVRPSPCWDIYAASKFALEGLSEAVAAVSRQWNIDIVLVEPGVTATDFMAQSVEMGDRTTSATAVYEPFVRNAFAWMCGRLAQGQNATEVAEVIADVVASKQRQMRYQTSAKGKQAVALRHCDPTGQSSVQEQERLIKQLWQAPLDATIGSSYR